ncbi:MAG: ankyrin repeat domain-containing protein [Alphaproteobacteria bacterium]
MNNVDEELRHAAATDNLSGAQTLIAAGGNPYSTDNDGMTAFNHAASNGLLVLKYLTEEAFADTKQHIGRRWSKYNLNTPSGKYNSTLLTYAAKVCNANTVRAMIVEGAENTVNGSGWNVLHAAAVMPDRIEVVKILADWLNVHGKLAKTTHPYETTYGEELVKYPAFATAYTLCQTRIAQDAYCPVELREYLKILATGH